MSAPDVPRWECIDPLLSNPTQQVIRTQIVGPTTKAGLDTVPVKLCGSNPLRLALVICHDKMENVFVSPTPITMSGAMVSSVILYTPVVIHASVYPGLVQGEWWGNCRSTTNMLVYDISLMR